MDYHATRSAFPLSKASQAYQGLMLTFIGGMAFGAGAAIGAGAVQTSLEQMAEEMRRTAADATRQAAQEARDALAEANRVAAEVQAQAATLTDATVTKF